MFTLGCDRAYLYGHPERELITDEQARYEDALAQRSRGNPAQYITGHQEFWGMDLIVTPAVLIPRPETEHVIEKVMACVGRALLSDLVIWLSFLIPGCVSAPQKNDEESVTSSPVFCRTAMSGPHGICQRPTANDQRPVL